MDTRKLRMVCNSSSVIVLTKEKIDVVKLKFCCYSFLCYIAYFVISRKGKINSSFIMIEQFKCSWITVKQTFLLTYLLHCEDRIYFFAADTLPTPIIYIRLSKIILIFPPFLLVWTLRLKLCCVSKWENWVKRLKTIVLHNNILDNTLIFTWAYVDNFSIVTSIKELLGLEDVTADLCVEQKYL